MNNPATPGPRRNSAPRAYLNNVPGNQSWFSRIGNPFANNTPTTWTPTTAPTFTRRTNRPRTTTQSNSMRGGKKTRRTNRKRNMTRRRR